MGIGSSRGEGRAVAAAGKAINSPLLEASMDGAQGVLLSIAGGSDLGLFEINEAASLVQEAAHPEANIIFGTVIDDSLGDEVRVTVIAAGFEAGGPTHKKLDPAAYGSGGGKNVIAAGVSGTTAPAAPAAPPAAPAPAAGNGYGGAHQSGTLPPPAAPSAFPEPRRPESVRPVVESPPEPPAYTPPAYSPPPASTPPPADPPSAPRPSFGQPAPADDLDDDVDVPPFMKR